VKKLVKFLNGCQRNITILRMFIKLTVSWSFFVKTHGKSACDGIIRTVKHITAG